ncbi:unnamed protein product [Cylindrotheca closterium]|uniref:CSC1/OSCA1-like 7TM region domain-containing protein n=1 Tax=Cylindrotheca closterium TaxID=2856 RepID=A0AAD2CTW5_9STRA|nr:unnamed protein product [Cylindrotheca closterium]
MATLAAIGITAGGGLGILTITLGCFTAAVINRNIFVAGRCVARPKDVIYNPNPKHPSQDRGYTPLGWMIWAMSLSYDTLLNGVPGTGTRDGGLKGHLLKVNLDYIVILRYHHLGMKVCALASVLYLAVIMPLYSTARCSSLRGDLDTPECINTTLTDYQQLTLANIPELDPYEDEDSILMALVNVAKRTNMGRLYTAVACTWIITWYTMKLLHLEWLDILAMRRVYYLEADHWKDRREELDNIAEEQNRKDASRIEKRSIWVPHPELRDTVPNIELYSILVGGLPSLPTDAVQDVEAVFSKKQSMDWQLSVTTAFFDHCVPNQPGFSSSVAAVTILPAATQITDAWQQWYKAAAKVRKLRYIRERIRYVKGKEGSDTEGSGSDVDLGVDQETGHPILRRRTSLHHDDILGSQTDVEVEDHLFHALNLGPEQTAVYGREFAQGAANFAPHGWFEWRINNAGLKELLVMEEAAARAVSRANVELQEARDRIGENSESEHISVASEDINTNITMQQQIFTPSLSENQAPTLVLPTSMKSNKSVAPLLSERHNPASSMKSENSQKRSFSSTHSHHSIDLDGSNKSNKSNETHSPRNSGKGGKSKKLSRESMAQLPTALGLEVGLWAERNNSGQAQTRKSRGRGGTSRIMSVDLDGARQMDSTQKNYYNDMAKMRSRHSTGTQNRTLAKRTSFDDDDTLANKSRIQRPSLKKAVTTGTPNVDMGNISTLLKNILKTGEGRMENGAESVSSNGKNGGSGSSSEIWETLDKETERKESLRARITKRKLEVDAMDTTGPTASDTDKNDSKETTSVAPTANKTDTSAAAAPESKGNGTENETKTNTPSSIMRPREHNENTNMYADWVNEDVEDEVEENLEIAYNFEQRAGLRKRENAVSFTEHASHTEKWGKVMRIVEETAKDMNGGNSRKRVISNGRWTCPSFRSICGGVSDRVSQCLDNFKIKSPELLDDFASDSTYAVVTFTSRQAAVAARHSLADSRGADRWVNLSDLPTPPLADAPVCSTSCRGCARPVTFSISDTQKKIRHFVALLCLAIVYFFYTIPLTAVQDMVSEERLTELYPEINEAQASNPIMANIFLGLIPALIWILFFAFLFTWLGWNCCQRAVRGGGAGPPIPYRIYVDSGVVLLCLFGLAPASPLIAPAACLYFLLCLPLLRWTMIFLYKPKFDVGGGRFPFIFDVCVSGMVVGQILLFTMMLLKKATGPALAAIIPFLPTIFYRYKLRRKYLRAFEDAALLQTSLLDGWDNQDDAIDQDREEFRKFLVDCHKAAYVPVCIASGDARTLITAEPAVVIPMEREIPGDETIGHALSDDSTDNLPSTLQPRRVKSTTPTFKSPQQRARKSIEEGVALPSLPSLPLHQPGVMMRRPSYTIRTPRAAPDSPVAHPSPLSVRTTMPASPGNGRRASNGSSGSRRRARDVSPGQERRGSNGVKASGSPRSSSPRGNSLLLSPLQQSQKRQPGKMMRRASRRMSTSNSSLPATPELPFSFD